MSSCPCLFPVPFFCGWRTVDITLDVSAMLHLLDLFSSTRCGVFLHAERCWLRELPRVTLATTCVQVLEEVADDCLLRYNGSGSQKPMKVS